MLQVCSKPGTLSELVQHALGAWYSREAKRGLSLASVHAWQPDHVGKGENHLDVDTSRCQKRGCR